MNDELLNDDGITLDNDHIENNEVSETAESGAELATATEEKQDKSNDGAQKAINKQHAKFREQERRADGLNDEVTELKKKLDAIEAGKGDITIPNMPDPYDEDYEEQVKARDEAIMRKATQDAQKNSILEQQSATKEAAKKADDERFQITVSGYNAQVTKHGLSADEIRVAGDTVVKNGIDGQVAEYILGDEDGPLITKYLAENPIVQDELRGLSTIQAAMKINSEIRTAASTMKPQASSAPDPTDVLSGRGAGEKTNPLIKGATFT